MPITSAVKNHLQVNICSLFEDLNLNDKIISCVIYFVFISIQHSGEMSHPVYCFDYCYESETHIQDLSNIMPSSTYTITVSIYNNLLSCKLF